MDEMEMKWTEPTIIVDIDKKTVEVVATEFLYFLKIVLLAVFFCLGNMTFGLRGLLNITHCREEGGIEFYLSAGFLVKYKRNSEARGISQRYKTKCIPKAYHITWYL